MSTSLQKRLPALLGLLVFATCAYVAVAFYSASAGLRVEKGDAPVEDARKQLERLDRFYEKESRRKPDEPQSDNLEEDLKSVLRLSDPILATVTWGVDEPDPQLGDRVEVHGARKTAARVQLDEEEEEVVQKIKKVLEDADEGQSAGDTDVEQGGRSYKFAWRRMSDSASRLTEMKFCGFVIFADLDRPLMDEIRGRMVRPLAVSAFLLLLAAVAVLAHFLLKARREALQKTTFVSNVSHELRTPLTSLLSYAEMLATGRCRTEERRAKACGVILDEGRRLDRMIQELLEFSRLERGTRRYRMEAFDLAAAVRETVERLGNRFADHGLAQKLPASLEVVSDRDTVRQVLENLLTNAAKYAAKDGVVEVAAEACGARVKVVVSDRGPGMTPSQMKHAFDAFWRADNSTTRTTGGYGIGLSVARAYARGLGGDLTVAARAGGGCEFTFEVPRNQGVTHD